MDQDPALATSEDEERAKVRKAQEVVERTSASVVQVCLIILTLLAIVYTLYFGAGIILPFVLALVLAMVLGPAMRVMNRRLHIPRMIVALLLIIALFSVVGALGYALSVPASAWIAKAPQSLSALMDKLSFLQRPIQLVEQGVHELQNAMSPGEQEPAGQQVVTVKQPSDVSSHVLGIGSTVLAGGRAFLGQGFTVMLLLFFFLASSESLLRRFVEILPRFDDKRRAVSIVTEIEDSISQYLLTISMMNALVGLLNGVAVWLLGMPDPLLFGTLAFLLNYVPVLGPATGVVIFFFVGVFSFPVNLASFHSRRDIPWDTHSGRRDHHAYAARAPLHAQPGYGDFIANVLGLAVGHTRRAALDAAVGSHENRVRSYRGSDAAWPSARRQFRDAKIGIGRTIRGTIQCADATTAMTTACR